MSSHFKSDEKILFTYDPSPNVYLIDILILFIFIALLIGPTSLLYWFSIFTGIEMDQPILFVLLLLVIIADLTIIPIFFLNKLYVVYKKINRSKNLLYLFTNKKILVKYSLDYRSISWQNVKEIAKSKKLIEPKTYTIEIYSNNLKILEINYIPNENPLVEKIRYLHENISKYQNI